VLFDVEELPTHGGSLRIYGRHAEDESKPVGPRVAACAPGSARRLHDALEKYAAFEEQVKATKRNILEFLIEAKRAGKTIAGYGAPGKGNTLLNYCGIRTDFLDFTVDRNPYKQGKFTPAPASRFSRRRPSRSAVPTTCSCCPGTWWTRSARSATSSVHGAAASSCRSPPSRCCDVLAAENSAPRVSIGLPVYNGEAFLEHTLASLLGQSFSDLELIISDNASTDATAEICREFASRDPRVRYFRQPRNRGAAFNWNFVVHQARGEFFKWASANDYCHETFIVALPRSAVRAPGRGAVLLPDADHLRRGEFVEYDSHDAAALDPTAAARFIRLMSKGGTLNEVSGLVRTAALRRHEAGPALPGR
jgi:hypothetical protein